jgi:hypothetical protein
MLIKRGLERAVSRGIISKDRPFESVQFFVTFLQMLGYAAVDLSPLLASFPSVTGWYNITNWVGRCRGQLKISVQPREPLPPGGWAQRDTSCQPREPLPPGGWAQRDTSCQPGPQLAEPETPRAAEYFAGQVSLHMMNLTGIIS